MKMNFFASEKPLYGIVKGHPRSIPDLQNNTPYIIIMKIHFMPYESGSFCLQSIKWYLGKKKKSG